MFLFRYLKQVMDETLRCSLLAPYGIRISDKDIEIAGYNVPANVSMISSLSKQKFHLYFNSHVASI